MIDDCTPLASWRRIGACLQFLAIGVGVQDHASPGLPRSAPLAASPSNRVRAFAGGVAARLSPDTPVVGEVMMSRFSARCGGTRSVQEE